MNGYNHHTTNPYLKKDIEQIAKISVIHELTHWYTETFHAKNVSRFLAAIKAGKYVGRYPKYENDYYENATDQEINAYVHEFKYIKSLYTPQVWDTRTFPQLIQDHLAIYSIVKHLTKLPEKHRMKRWNSFMKRLKKELLLGNKMYGYTI